MRNPNTNIPKFLVLTALRTQLKGSLNSPHDEFISTEIHLLGIAIMANSLTWFETPAAIATSPPKQPQASSKSSHSFSGR
ncbi:uncharacterized protein CLUP02_12109 [Colletotrichum lupini]|uniref:Uncharacterized protein n=1 Tax=Colletotrichum lupini TaxID=145971 RepID=A0A9Q8SZY7_9PEZI|nr:uncharacterized protein CLUP02_12109 [Colletotrichum lupini]UQC86607.1 hypothetical protein CLUP02_12109 [Colletotrichum lupini]